MRKAERASPHAISSAALLVSAALVGTAAMDARSVRGVPCDHPFELRAEGGWSTEIGCHAVATEGGRSLRGPAILLFGGKLDLNHANTAALDVLPGIGPSRAAAIVASRNAGLFATLSDLERVRGIGPETVRKLRGWAHVPSVSTSGAVSTGPRAGQGEATCAEGSGGDR